MKKANLISRLKCKLGFGILVGSIAWFGNVMPAFAASDEMCISRCAEILKTRLLLRPSIELVIAELALCLKTCQ